MKTRNKKMNKSMILLISGILILSLVSAGMFIEDKNVLGFDLEKVFGFNLEEISDVFSEIESGELGADELVFLDEFGNEIKVEDIEKIPYSGKIYDVDVENDVVLVRRKNDIINSGNLRLDEEMGGGDLADNEGLGGNEGMMSSNEEQTTINSYGGGISILDRNNMNDYLIVWSGNSNDGAITGATFNETGGQNDTGGFEFDGAGDYVDAGSGSSIDNVFAGGGTISAWFYAKSYGESNWGRIVFKGSSGSNDLATQIFVENDAGQETLKVYRDFDVGNGLWNLTNGGILLSTWYHVAVTYNEDSADNDPIIYINGVSQTVSEVTTPSGTAVTDAGENLIIGSRGSDREFNGTIDQVMIWNRSLSADEISALYGNQSNKYNVAYYTAYQNLTTSGGNTTFNIDTEADFVFPDFKFFAGNLSSRFYTPILFGTGDITMSIYDGVAPTINMVHPVDNSRYNTNTSLSLNYTASDDVGLSVCWYTIDAGATNSSGQTCGTNWTINVTDESYTTVTVYANDTTNNVASDSSEILADTGYPEASYKDPSPREGGAVGRDNAVVNVSGTDTATNVSVFIDDGSLVGWWRMDDVNGSGDPTDYLACYDNETKIMTDEGLKYFWELTGDEMVMTLNAETGEKEWQLPMERQVYDYEGKMYRIKTKKGDLSVSPEHKIYVERLDEDKEKISLTDKVLHLKDEVIELFKMWFGIKNG